jgi:Holliday junction resolvase
MDKIYLHTDDIKSIQKFMEAFPGKDVVLLEADSSSGIGTILTATITGVTLEGQIVNVTKPIVDESSW